MQRLVLIMIVVATTFDFLVRGDQWGRFAIFPKEAKFLSDLLSVAAAAVVVVLGTRQRFQFVRAAYWVVFALLLFTTAAGALVNDLEPGPMVAGIRTYWRAVPWFLIGAVYAFSQTQIKTQLKLLLWISLAQVPLAIEQRLRTHAGGRSRGEEYVTGDFTTGTLLSPGPLSIFLVCGLCVLVALLVRRHITARQAAYLFPLMLLPTMINETKVTIVLLPVALLVTFVSAAEPGRRLRAVMVAGILVLVSGVVFATVYNSFRKESQPHIDQFLTDRETTEQYLLRTQEIGSDLDKPAGRGDAIIVSLRSVSADPPHFVFGYGVGNASDSALGAKFVGRHFDTYRLFMVSAFARVTLELGLLGLGLVLVVMSLVFRDALVVARSDNGVLGALGAAMAGITALVVISIVYGDLINHTAPSFVFWYLAGLVAGCRMREAAAARAVFSFRMAVPSVTPNDAARQ